MRFDIRKRCQCSANGAVRQRITHRRCTPLFPIAGSPGASGAASRQKLRPLPVRCDVHTLTIDAINISRFPVELTTGRHARV